MNGSREVMTTLVTGFGRRHDGKLRIENQESLSAANVAAAFVILPAFAFGGRDRFAKNAAKLVAFVENRLNTFGRKQMQR